MSTREGDVDTVSGYWHGGAPGREPGDRLLTLQELRQRGMPAAPRAGESQIDRIFLASDLEFARAFAFRTEITSASGAGISRGSLYRVEPIGNVEEDPDFAGVGISWMAAAARVVDVVEIDVRMRERDAVRAIGAWSTWDDGRPMYLEDGRLNLTAQMEALGVTQAELDGVVRPWTHWPAAIARADRAFLGRLRARSGSAAGEGGST